MNYINNNGFSKIEAELDAAKEWTDYAYEVAAPSLFAKTASWFSGANIPGKKRTFLSWREKSEIQKNVTSGVHWL